MTYVVHPRGSRQTSGSLAGLRLCIVMHVGNSGGSRAWPPGVGLRSRTSYGTPGGRRCSSAMGGDQERCRLRSPLGSSDRATALVARCVTRMQGTEAQRRGR